MKKIISLALVLAMCVSMTTVSYAATLKERIAQEFANMGLSVDLDNTIIPVATDIEISSNGGTTYQDAPITIYESAAAATDVALKATIDMSVVRAAFGWCEQAVVNIGATQQEKDLMYVTGQFIVNIDYPKNGFAVNSASYVENTAMAMHGFSSDSNNHEAIFEETAYRTKSDLGNGYERLTITIDVKNGTGLDELANKLTDLTLTYAGNSVNKVGTYTIRGSITGQTAIMTNITGSDEQIGNITYDFDQWDGKENNAAYRNPADDISATIIVNTSTGTSLGGGGYVKKIKLKVFDDEDLLGGTEHSVGEIIKLKDLKIPQKAGYSFAGFYFDKDFTKPVTGDFKLTEDTEIYVKWAESVLNSADHFAYIIGYPMEDGREEVRPENNITREEIATVFYRLLNDNVRDELFTATNSFPDVEEDRWSNKAISTMANGKYVLGYEDDTFRPANPITRAEFVTVAARFYDFNEEVFNGESSFEDVGNHWAKNYINYATTCGWIDGYEDNTFRPNKYITRAEVMKIINHMLNRSVDEDGLTEDTKRWIDNSADKWYYYEVIEATNFHSYERPADAEAEDWTAILENQILIDKPKYEDA